MSLSHRCDHISTAPERCRVRVFLLASVTSSLLAAVTSPSFDCGCTGMTTSAEKDDGDGPVIRDRCDDLRRRRGSLWQRRLCGGRDEQGRRSRFTVSFKLVN
ncbi:hypothetical protein HID58_016462 [Brassica napus]|uniref:Secreted protein n=1 Tax=Brassica napus TaxID=3708 RepID=A0ABQ8DMY6_BRANA|nr:hypothetical protein HID58_016462 [Brassica napus]